MVELSRRPRETESGLLAPDVRLALTSADLSKMFGSNYIEQVVRKASEFGIREPLEFFSSPKPHRGSQAVYLAEQFVGDDLVLVPVLGPGMKTSKHHHEDPMGNEIYLHIAGESFINVSGNTLALNRAQSRIDVPLQLSHRVTTKEGPSLTLIVMRNARLVSPDRLHIKDSE